METISIIGDGAMATLCAVLLGPKGCRLRLWSAFEANAAAIRTTGRNDRFLPGVKLPALEVTTDPAQAFASSTIAISAVPAQFARRVWTLLAPHCPPALAICSVTKGIENDSLLRPTQVLAEALTGSPAGDWPLAALSGPSIAAEVAAGLPATVVAASTDEALARRVQQLFTTPSFRVYTNGDLTGVELAGATKNVVAIAAGILDGLEAGDNAKAALLTRGLVEITRLGVSLGGRTETFYGLAGLGDLVTTCVSPHGRNRTFGEAVGRGQSVEQAQACARGVVEGVATARSVRELSRRQGVEMPIVEAVNDVLFDGVRPKRAIANLMTRRPKAEGI